MPRFCPHCGRVPEGSLGMHIQFCPVLRPELLEESLDIPDDEEHN